VQWALLLLAAPFLLFPTPQRSLALLAVPVLWVIAWAVSRKPLPITPLNLPILLMLIMVLVSLYATYDVAFSLPKLAGMVLGVGMYFAFVRASEAARPRQWGRIEKRLPVVLVLIFLACGLGVAGLGLLGTRWFSKFDFLQPLVKRLPFLIQGLPGAADGFHPNEVAGALLWVLPLLLVMMLAALAHLKEFSGRIGRGRALATFLALLISAGFTGGVFLLTQSRSGLIGLAGGLVLMAAMLFPPKARWIYIVSLVLLSAGLGLAAWRLGWVQTLYADTSAGSGMAASLNTLNGRVEVWQRAIYGIQDFPITGMGMNTFRKVVNVLYPFYTIDPNYDIGHAHDEFLQAALDLGLPGLVGFIALYLVSFWMLGQSWRAVEGRITEGITTPGMRGLLASPGGVKAMVLGLGGGLLAHAIYGLTDAVALGAKPGILFWMLLGLVAGLYLQTNLNPRSSIINPQCLK
jgi:O-antigen ligase